MAGQSEEQHAHGSAVKAAADRPDRQTVVLVHGTYSAPAGHLRRWWQGDDARGFVAKLEAALQSRALNLRCRAHCEPDAPFHWSGENDWVARIRGSSALARHITELAARGWRCHLIGHSHGGNVIAETLSTLSGTPAEGNIASVTTLGTPFVDTLDAIDRHKRRQRRLSATFLAIGAAFWLFTVAFVFHDMGADFSREAYAGLVVSLALPAMGAWGFLGHALAERRRRKKARAAQPIPALALNSRYDEAWQLLHHVRETDDPLAVSEGLIPYLRRQMRAARARQRAVNAALSFAPGREDAPPRWITWLFGVFYAISLAAFLLPIVRDGASVTTVLVGSLLALVTFLLLAALVFAFGFGAWRPTQTYFEPLSKAGLWVQSLGVLPSEMVTYLVRARSWSLLQRWTLGLHGYAFDLPPITTTPASAGAARFTLEMLDRDVEERALRSRSAWLERHLGSTSEFFSRVVLSASDAADLLQTIESDASLVHAAYYTDEACIERIADWIAAHALPPPSSPS